ncbi:MAG: DUF3352 domain-containing protein [Planctomycetes bacterium]|nr:DUF3352 domain-containing protein [Planctomycetota bacterium]
MAMIAGPGMLEILFLLMGGGSLAGASLLGLPPGERSEVLVQCPAEDALLYVEWAERSSGKPGGEGIAGLAADPEIQAFIAKVRKAIETNIQAETAGAGQVERTMGENLPPLIIELLNRPGCFFLEFDEKARPIEGGAEGLPNVALIALSGARAALVVDGGAQAEKIAERVQALVDLLPERIRKDNLDHQPLSVFDVGPPLVLHRHKNFFLIGLGAGTVDRAVEGLDGERKGLGENARFQSALKRVAVEQTASITWANVEAMLKKAAAVLGPESEIVTSMAKTLGIDTVGYGISVIGVEDGQIVSRGFKQTGGNNEGLLALTAGRGITTADLALVPADADLVYAFSFNMPKVLAAARQIVRTADPPSAEKFDAVLKQLESDLGFSFEQDLFEAFGDVWVVYDSPSAGGVFLTGAVLGVEVRDAQKAEHVFSQLMKVLNQVLPGELPGRFGGRWRRGVYLNNEKFLDRTIYYVNTVGDDVPFAPAFTVTDSQMLVAPHPQALKAHLRFLADKQIAGGDFGSKRGALLESAGTTGETICFSYSDARQLVRVAYTLAPYIGQLIFADIQRYSDGIDIFALPSARAILPYVSESVSTVVRTKEGLRADSRGGLPLPVGGGGVLAVNGLAWFLMAIPARARPVEPPAAAIQIDSLDRGTETERAIEAPRPRSAQRGHNVAATAG